MKPPSVLPNPDPDLADAPHISLAGLSWPIPPLAPKQNRIIVPAIMRVLPAIASMVGTLTQNPEDTAPAIQRASVTLSEAVYDDLLTVAYHALRRAHPDLKREEFEEMPIGTNELVQAMPTIAKQTGVMREVPAGTELPPGEA